MLKVRPPMDSRGANGTLCEWGLTRIKGSDRRECHVEGIWFMATIGKTLEARDTIERLSVSRHMTVKEVRETTEKHRALGRRVHVIRSVGDVRVENTFTRANDNGFADGLEWGRPG